MNVIARAKNIVLTPKTEWPVIEGEAGDTKFLFSNYVAILGAIPPICGLIGALAFSAPGTQTSVSSEVFSAVIWYAVQFAGCSIGATIGNALAPRFGGRRDYASAMKLSVYGSTPAWLSGVFSLIPSFWPLVVVLSLYSFYLIYLGLPVLMKVPQERAMTCTVVGAIVTILLIAAIGAVVGGLIFLLLLAIR